VFSSEIAVLHMDFHEVGDFSIGLHLHSEVNVDITVKVVADE